MSRVALALRSRVSPSTVNRVLTGDLSHTTVANLRAISRALGVEVFLQEQESDVDLMERQAKAKAEQLVGMVQGTMGLEAQGVDGSALEQMKRRTVHELVAGSRRSLWST